MNKRTKIIVSIVGITIVLLALLGITYAYYLTRIQGNTNTNSISVTTAKLELVYGDNSAEILTGSGALMPTVETDVDDAIGTKTFTVTNNGNDSSYVVIIDNVSVTKVSDGSATTFLSNDFRYTLTCTKSDGTKCNEVNDLTIFPIKGGILVSNDIVAEDVHTYTLTLWYIDTGVDQSDDMGKSYQARVSIADVNQMENPFKTGVTATDNASLAYNIIKNAKDNKNGTKLLNVADTPVAEGISTYKGNVVANYYHGFYGWDGLTYGATAEEANNGSNAVTGDTDIAKCESVKNQYISDSHSCYNYCELIGKVADCTADGVPILENMYTDEQESSLVVEQDDLGTSYYYRGNVEDNYVNFAGMCWRIVRIDGNGNTKLILEDQDEVCSTTMNGNWDIEASDGTNITTDGTNPYRTGNFGWDDSLGGIRVAYLNPLSDMSMVNAFKYFQTNTLTNKISSTYENKSLSDFLVSGNWCLNNKAYSDSAGTTLLENPDYSSTFYYDSYVRLYGKTTKEPTLKCPAELLYKFDDNQDGVISINETDMYVGTITADEIVYAGGKVHDSNANFYLINNWQVMNYKNFWTLSLYNYYDASDTVFILDYYGNLYSNDVHNENVSFRPAINLSANVSITSGEGTLEKPYIIG